MAETEEKLPVRHFPDVCASRGPRLESSNDQFTSGLKSAPWTKGLLEQLSAEMTSSLDRHYEQLTRYFDTWMHQNEQTIQRVTSQCMSNRIVARGLGQRGSATSSMTASTTSQMLHEHSIAPELSPSLAITAGTLKNHMIASKRVRESALRDSSNPLPVRDIKWSINTGAGSEHVDGMQLASGSSIKNNNSTLVADEGKALSKEDNMELVTSKDSARSLQPLGSNLEPIGEYHRHSAVVIEVPTTNGVRSEKTTSSSGGAYSAATSAASKRVSKKQSKKSIFSLDDLDENKRQTVARLVGSRQMALTTDFQTAMEDRQTWIQRFVNNYNFEMFFATLIMTNSILVGVQVQHGAANRTDASPVGFMVVQHAYAYLFAVELVCRMGAQGLRFFCNENWFWNYLDMFIVLTSLMEVVVDLVRLLSDDTMVSSTENMSSIRIVRIIRMTRLVRVFRIIRIVRFVRALRTLVYSIICTLKSLVWSMLLLVMIVYVFSILFTQATTLHFLDDARNTTDDELLSQYWGTLPRSMFTLLKSICGGLSWEICVQPLSSIHWFWVMLFNGFILFVYFAVLNVVTGVFCQSAIESAQHDQEMLIQEQIANKHLYIQKLRDLFKDLDSADTGWITINELEKNLGEPRVEAFFSSLELEPSDAWALFKLLDMDRSSMVDIEEFVVGCLRLRGQAKAIDLAKQSYELKFLMRKLSLFMKFVEERFTMLMPDSAPSVVLSMYGSRGSDAPSTMSTDATERWGSQSLPRDSAHSATHSLGLRPLQSDVSFCPTAD